MKKPIWRAVLLILLAHTSVVIGAAQVPSDKTVKLDKLMLEYADCCQFTGTVLVSEHDKIIFQKGYGMADREWAIVNTPDVKFRIGSITKQFTSMLVMQQVAKGNIRLDGHISDYLSYYRKDTGEKVTITQLLNHTSGIPSYTGMPKFFDDVSRNYYAPDDFVKKYCSGDLEFEPGSKFHYNNSGYFLLGAILEHVTGKKYDALLEENILAPLDMKDTGYDLWATILPKRASGYQLELVGVSNAPYLDMSLPFSAGSMYSTVQDMYKWDQALYTDKLLSAELKKKMFTPGLEDYGFGWVIKAIPEKESAAGKTMITHGGGINGFNTIEVRVIEDHDLIVAFNNTPGANLTELAKDIRDILYGQEPAPPKRSLSHDLGVTVAQKGVNAAISQYRGLKLANSPNYTFEENALNSLGGRLLDKDRTADAIAIFKLNIEEYPKSSNAYDSLGEAYSKDGQKGPAIESYRKAVELDPKNQNAVEKLKELEKQ
ncbi:MAG: serine hydrolase [Candidatus Acidiferrum sp.]